MTKEKIRKATSGENNYQYGTKRSEEDKAKLSPIQLIINFNLLSLCLIKYLLFNLELFLP